MQVHFTIDTLQDSGAQIAKVAAALFSLTDIQTGETPATPAAGKVQRTSADAEPEPVATQAKANGKAAPKAKANGKAAPKPKAEEEEEEDEGTDYGALRLEIRTRFADWAEQVGMIEGKALLDEYSVGKFSELDNSQLEGFSKSLARLEAEL
jgi:hypothetical protein